MFLLSNPKFDKLDIISSPPILRVNDLIYLLRIIHFSTKLFKSFSMIVSLLPIVREQFFIPFLIKKSSK